VNPGCDRHSVGRPSSLNLHFSSRRLCRFGWRRKEDTHGQYHCAGYQQRQQTAGNQGAAQGFPVSVKSLADFGPMPEPVEDGETFDDNAYKKSLHYAKVLGLPCLADDSGLVVDALDGRPGVYSARYAGLEATDWQNCEKLLAEMAGRTDRAAHFVCVLSLATPAGPALTWEGRCDGEITGERRGNQGLVMIRYFSTRNWVRPLPRYRWRRRAGSAIGAGHWPSSPLNFPRCRSWLRQRMAEIKPPKPDHSEFEHNDWSKERM
jgi:XTP/dITP diphosphohydrolase